MFKVVFTDVDGTLLNEERAISPLLKEAVGLLNDRGVPMILISSRMPAAMQHLQQDLNILGLPMVCYNGALILDKEKVIINQGIDVGIGASIVDFAKKIDFHTSLYHKDEWYVPAMDYWAKREQNNTKVTPKVADLSAVLNQWKNEAKHLHKIMCMGAKTAIDQLVAYLEQHHQEALHLYRSKDTYLEITTKEVSKEIAVRSVLAALYPNITMKDVLAFGDNYNDMSMLKAVGRGVAVANARQEVLAIADDTTDANYDNGVANYLIKTFRR